MEEHDLINEQFASWDALSAHANERAGKAWAMLITGTHPSTALMGIG